MPARNVGNLSHRGVEQVPTIVAHPRDVFAALVKTEFPSLGSWRLGI